MLVPLFFLSCSEPSPDFLSSLPQADRLPPITPYAQDSLVLPANIAPLNFCLLPDSAQGKAWVWIKACSPTGADRAGRQRLFRMRSSGTDLSLHEWRALMREACGGHLLVRIYAERNGKWQGYRPLRWFVSPDTIDPYLLFRASQYEEGEYGNLYVQQRNLTSFENVRILDNRLMDNNCMNCHDCLDNKATEMVVHLRDRNVGTLLIRGDSALKVKVPSSYNLRLTYPAWHPSGKYIAFSTNLPRSVHFANATQKIIYTLDTLGSIVVLDLERMRLFSCPELTRVQDENVFPTWSKDGKRLYFCRSPRKEYDSLPCPSCADTAKSFRQNRVEQIWDDLMQIDFDPLTRRFSNEACTYPFSRMRKSATMPKLSKDGRYMIVSLLKTSSFPIQNLGDLYRVDLQDLGRVTEIRELNTPGSEKGHSFSSTGKWMVFSSSRRTMAVPETYITHFDPATGHFSPPFLVPQKRGDFYLTNLKGFVFPVLSTVPAALQAHALARTAMGPALELEVDTSLRRFLLKEGEVSMKGGH